jgi:hypothetical protein
MADFVVETTNESGVVEQEHVSVNQMGLSYHNRSLARIGGLERATTLKTLFVPINALSGVESHAFSLLFVQLDNNCFVDVPACVLASTQLTFLHVSLAFSSVCYLLTIRSSLRTACCLCPLPLVNSRR